MRRTRTLEAAALSIAAILGTPVLIVGVFFLTYLTDYEGLCGPYPVDVPAVPCSFWTYVERFFDSDGFQIIGLVMLSIASMAIAAIAVAIAWVIWAIRHAVTTRRVTVGSRDPTR